MSTVEIPLSAQPQRFSISLLGIQYRLTMKWNQSGGMWVLDIADANGNGLVNGIPIIPGIDLLAQYGYLNFGGKLFASTDNDADAVPTFENLGTNAHLFFVTPDA